MYCDCNHNIIIMVIYINWLYPLVMYKLCLCFCQRTTSVSRTKCPLPMCLLFGSSTVLSPIYWVLINPYTYTLIIAWGVVHIYNCTLISSMVRRLIHNSSVVGKVFQSWQRPLLSVLSTKGRLKSYALLVWQCMEWCKRDKLFINPQRMHRRVTVVIFVCVCVCVSVFLLSS